MSSSKDHTFRDFSNSNHSPRDLVDPKAPVPMRFHVMLEPIIPFRGTEEGGRLRLAALVEQRGLGLRVARQVVHTSATERKKWAGGHGSCRGPP